VDIFEVRAKQHVHQVRNNMREVFAGYPVTRMQNHKPILVARIDAKTEQYRAANELGKGDKLTYWDFEAIGDIVVDRLEEFESNGRQDREVSSQDFLDAYYWLCLNATPSRYTNSVRSLYYNTDQKLMAGRLFDRLLEVLAS